jgi:uncharacterized membrane protein
MATVGPLVKNEFFFIAAVLLLPLLMLLIPGRQKEAAVAEGATGRLERARSQRQARARVLGATLGIVILAALGFGFVYAQTPVMLSPAIAVEPGGDGAVRIPLSSFEGTALRRFAVTIDGTPVRFIAVPIEEGGEIATAFDACKICGARGYYQDGPNVTCLHCGSAIYPPSIGQAGGCNPIPLPSKVEGGELVLQMTDLQSGAGVFSDASRAHMGHSGAGH